MERWKQICVEIDLSEIDDLINEIMVLNLPLMSKMDVIESTNHMFDPSFECYLWCQRKIPCLYYLAVVSSPHSERMEHVNEIDRAMTYDPPDFAEIDPELDEALRQISINRRIEDAIDLYGEPIEGEWDDCPIPLPAASISRGLCPGDSVSREEVIRHLRPIIDHNQHDPQILREALEWGLTRESYTVLLEEFRDDLLQKIQELTHPEPDELLTQLRTLFGAKSLLL